MTAEGGLPPSNPSASCSARSSLGEEPCSPQSKYNRNGRCDTPLSDGSPATNKGVGAGWGVVRQGGRSALHGDGG